MNEWYGTLPSGWEITRIKNIFALRDERNSASMDEVRLISLYTHHGVIPHDQLEKTTGNRATTVENYKIVHEGDIIVNIILCWQGAIGLSKWSGVTSPAYDIYRPKADICGRYFHYLFRLPQFSGECYRYGHGIMAMRWRTYSDEFSAISVPLPSRDEQDQIVRFLDWKVSQINKLINTKRKQIRLLQEQKQAVINAAVTKGGEGWHEISLANLGDFRKGSGGSREDDDINGAACIRYGDIYRSGKMMLSEPITRIKHETTTRYARLAVDEMLFALSGETKEEIGQALVNDIAEDTWTSGDVAIFTAGENIKPHFLTYALRCPYIVAQRAALAKGDIIVHISVGALRQLRVAVPPVTEQLVIVGRLDKICTAADKTVMGIEREISLLHEYRTRLISDVVTGKLDVRDVVVPKYEAVQEIAESKDVEGDEELNEETGDV